MISDVSLTAMGTALQRAAESAREDRLFTDPFSAILSKIGKTVLDQRRKQAIGASSPAKYTYIADDLQNFSAIRTRFFDDFVHRAVGTDGRQVVILGAGLDCRAYRLNFTDRCQVFEIDLPGILEFKESVLTEHQIEPACRRSCVHADVTHDWRDLLTAAGFDRSKPTIWLMEGMLPYLEQADIAKLLTSVESMSCSGSSCAFDDCQDLYRSFAESCDIRDFGGVISMNSPDIAAREFGNRGWTLASRSCSELASEYGRADAEAIGKMWVAALV